MQERAVGNKSQAEKPWKGLVIASNNEGLRKLIDLANQGVERKDRDGGPIDKDDAEFTIAIGVFGLRGVIGMTKRHHDNIDPDLIRRAEKLIEANEENVLEYVNTCLLNAKKPSYMHDGPKLTESQLFILSNVMAYFMGPQFSTTS